MLKLLLIAGLAAATLTARAQTPAATAAPTPSVTALPAGPVDPMVGLEKVGNATFKARHEWFLQRGKESPIGVLFLGDSIMEGWTTKALAVWKEHYWQYNPANFGIGGDSTQHVIWRIENGELDGIQPRVVVFMLGTNNTGAHTAEQITAADKKILRMIREKLPEAKILLLAIFPRGPRKNRDGSLDDGIKRMEIIRAVNVELAKLDDGKTIRFLDVGSVFTQPDGKLSEELLSDQLHPNAKGYKRWAEKMQPLLDEMMRQ